MTLEQMLVELGGGCYGSTTDGTWIFQTRSGFGASYSGQTLEQAVRAAWKAEVQKT